MSVRLDSCRPRKRWIDADKEYFENIAALRD